jgi:GTP-binding protein LepA
MSLPSPPIDPVALTQDLIRCPSVTPDSAGCFELIEQELVKLGFTCRRYRFGNVENLYARRGTAAPNFCFAGHVDVVPPGNVAVWRVPPFAGTDEERRAVAAYIATGLKQIGDVQVGDTVTLANDPASEPLPGYRLAKPVVFAGLYPVESNAYTELREALEKLALNDASLTFAPEKSAALGFGFRCGFLGLLHMEIVRERLEREYNLTLLITAPSVEYNVMLSSGEIIAVANPSDMPDVANIAAIEEPVMAITVIVPTRYIGTVMELVTGKRGAFVAMDHLDPQRVSLKYKIPLNEIVIDFYDQLKSRTQGYASLDYTLSGYQESDLVKLDILVNHTPVDALSLIVHKDSAYNQGRQLVDRLRRLIPRQMFEVPVQAAVGSRVIARESIRAMRKDVLAKCYGGDISRKRKLLEKQKEGKKRMKMVGNVEIPQEAFMAVLSLDDDGDND